jgi:HSP20 family molecular chaperone IbpA
MEVHFGFFETSIELPSGYDLDEARALYENGFLTIEVPSVSGPSSKSIQIESLAGE